MTDTAQQVRSRRFACLDGYRGLAAMTVVVYHVMGRLSIHLDHPTLGAYTARLGNYGVTMFFLLSGFLLYRPFVVAHFESREGPSWGSFYLRRLVRIIPAYWVALTFLFFVFHYSHLDNISDAVTYYGFGQIYRPGGYPTGGLGQAWSLCVEMSFYLLLPLLAYVLAHLRLGRGILESKMRGQLVGLALLFAFSTGYKVWAVLLQDRYPVAGLWLPARLDLFVLGMLLAVTSVWIASGQQLPALVRRFTRSPLLCLLFALELYWLFSQLNLPRLFGDETLSQTMLHYTVAGLSAFFLLIPGTLGDESRGLVTGFFRSAPMAWLGMVSYGIYLWHTMWIEFGLRLADNGQLSRSVWVQLVFVTSMTLACAALSYWLIERPLIDRVHSHIKSRRRKELTHVPAPAVSAAS
jgi:peptidoglycan/LPS O-acetylase OafA/YrhL